MPAGVDRDRPGSRIMTGVSAMRDTVRLTCRSSRPRERRGRIAEAFPAAPGRLRPAIGRKARASASAGARFLGEHWT